MLAFSVQQSFHSTVCGYLGSLGLILCYYGNMLEAYPIRLAPSRAITLKARVRASYVKEDLHGKARNEPAVSVSTLQSILLLRVKALRFSLLTLDSRQ